MGPFVPMYHFATCKKPCSGLKLLIPVELTLCEYLDQSILGLQFWLCCNGSGPKWVKSQLRLSTVCVTLSSLAGYRPLRPGTVNVCSEKGWSQVGDRDGAVVTRLSPTKMDWAYSDLVTHVCWVCRALKLIVIKSGTLDNVGLHCQLNGSEVILTQKSFKNWSV